MTTTRCTGSMAAQTPTVQDSWLGEVLNTSRARKKVWFSVWDLPSPVFPKMETTLRSSSGLHPNLLTKSSSSVTWELKSTSISPVAMVLFSTWAHPWLYLHLLLLVHQEEAAHPLDLSFQDLHLWLLGVHAVFLGRFDGRIHGHGVLPLVDAAVGALLAVQTQVGLAALAAHGRPEPTAAAVALAGVAKGNVARRDPNPVVVPHALLAMELQLAAGALQAAAFVALERGLIWTPAGVVLLAAQHRVHSFIYSWTLAAHLGPDK